MKTIAISAGLMAVALTLGTGGEVAQAAASPMNAQLDRVLTAAAEAGFSGVVLVGDARNTLYEKSLGLADRESKLANSPDLAWRWASVSKQLTSLVVAQLVAEGKLSLDASVGDYLPPAQFPATNAKTITIRQLLQHTSGLPNPSDGTTLEMPIPPFYRTPASAVAVHSAPTRGSCSGPAKQAPGARFDYNNCDYFVLGAIIEQLTGQRYAEVVATRVLGPLKLASVYLGGAAGTEQRLERVKGYEAANKPEQTSFSLTTYGASGGWLGTPRDLLKLDQAMLGDDILSAKMKEQFWAGNPKFGYAALAVWSFPASLKGCKGTVELVERRGHIGEVQVRNILAPKLSKAVVVFTNRGDWTFGEIWQGKGFSYDLLSAALCSN